MHTPQEKSARSTSGHEPCYGRSIFIYVLGTDMIHRGCVFEAKTIYITLTGLHTAVPPELGSCPTYWDPIRIYVFKYAIR